MLLAGFLMGPAVASAQEESDDVFNQRVDPEGIFDFVDSHVYPNNMSFAAVVMKDEQTVTDALVAVYASDGIRGKDIVDPKQGNKAFITVYGEASVPLFFKVYTNGQTYVVDQDLVFEPNGMVGITENYVITLEDPVLLGDVKAISYYIVGTPPATFVKTAADVNKDGNITIADAVTIVKGLL